MGRFKRWLERAAIKLKILQVVEPEHIVESNIRGSDMVKRKSRQVRVQTSRAPSELAGAGKVFAHRGRGKAAQTKFAYKNKEGEVLESDNGQPVKVVRPAVPKPESSKPEVKPLGTKPEVRPGQAEGLRELRPRRRPMRLSGRSMRITPKLPRLI